MKTKIIYIFFFIFFLIGGVACKKVVQQLPNNTTITPETSSSDYTLQDTLKASYVERLYDSVFLYAKQIYLWYESLPSNKAFNIRQYITNDTLSGLQKALFHITQYAKSSTGELYEQSWREDESGNRIPTPNTSKYSHIVRISDTKNGGTAYANNLLEHTRMTLDGKENSLGITIGFVPARYTWKTEDSIPASGNGDSTITMIRSVTKESPAYHAGLKRGDVIALINGKRLGYNTDIQSLFNELFNASSVTITTYKASTKTFKTVDINKEIYTFNPIFKDTILSIRNKKIGYFAYKAFTDYTSNSKIPFKEVFERFAQEGITDLVVDLRHNGGGYVESAHHLANYLAPTAANNQVQHVQYYNSIMQQKKAYILQHLPQRDIHDQLIPNRSYYDFDYSIPFNTSYYNKIGSLNLPSIYFIVSSQTASASEMVINSLQPYMQVVTIGASFSDKGLYTYGKPVGFFEVRIGNYSMWMSNFETRNAHNYGGYYQGMKTDFQAFDDIRFDFGDPRESCLKEAIRKIVNDATYQPMRKGFMSNPPNETQSYKGISQPSHLSPTFIGMIDRLKQ